MSAGLIINSEFPRHFIDIILRMWHRKILSEAVVYGPLWCWEPTISLPCCMCNNAGLSPSQRKSTMFSVLHAAHTLTLTQSLPQLVLHYIASILVLLPLCSSTNFIVSRETIAWHTRRIQRKPKSACKNTMSKVKQCPSIVLTLANFHSINQSVLRHQVPTSCTWML